VSYRDQHRLARVGPAPDGDGDALLEDHVVAEDRGEPDIGGDRSEGDDGEKESDDRIPVNAHVGVSLMVWVAAHYSDAAIICHTCVHGRSSVPADISVHSCAGDSRPDLDQESEVPYGLSPGRVGLRKKSGEAPSGCVAEWSLIVSRER